MLSTAFIKNQSLYAYARIKSLPLPFSIEFSQTMNYRGLYEYNSEALDQTLHHND